MGVYRKKGRVGEKGGWAGQRSKTGGEEEIGNRQRGERGRTERGEW